MVEVVHPAFGYEYVLESTFCPLAVKYHLMQLCGGELGQSPGGYMYV